jgi:AraC-like DNA-binding protein/quercetin dioxygenase-like cupin family protein
MSKKRHIGFHGNGRGQVRVLAWEYAAGEVLPAHAHDWHQFVFATSGVMTIHTPGDSWVVPTNRAVWVPAFAEHSIVMSGKVAMRTLYVSPRLRDSLWTECRVVHVPPLLRELLLHTVALGGLDRRVLRHRPVLELLLDQIADLPSAPLRVPMVRDSRARAIAQHLLSKPEDSRTLEQLAHRSGGSKRTIERAFRIDTGMTFGRWRQHVRLVHALRLLAAGESVTRVALYVGYGSLSAFVRSFREAFGATPGRYYRAGRDLPVD